jgi:protein tyrosine phosphatase (PTP) superfamily phosphohydrolase (DUF442 family)
MPTALEAIHGVVNATQPLPLLLNCGQPDLPHLEAFQAAGGAAIIDLRAPHERRSFDEPAAAERLGLSYARFPVGPTPLTDDLMESILGAIRAQAGKLVMLHCASANRTGGPLIAHLILDHGFDEADAIAVATRSGLRAPEILSWGVDYARRHAT